MEGLKERRRQPNRFDKYVEVAPIALLGGIAGVVSAALSCQWWDCGDTFYWEAFLGGVLVILVVFLWAAIGKALKPFCGRRPFNPIGSSSFQIVTFSQEVINYLKPGDTVKTLDEENLGWLVPFSDGQVTKSVIVYKRYLWQWLIQCYTEQLSLNSNQSPISFRRNQGVIDREQWKARLFLLEQADCIIKRSTASNARKDLRILKERESAISNAWEAVNRVENWESSRKV